MSICCFFYQFLLILLLAPYFAAHAVIFSKSAPEFYKSPHSQFPSGQAPESDLLEKKIRTENLSSFQVSWENREYSFRQNELFREIQVAEQVQSVITTPLRSKTSSSSEKVGEIRKTEIFQVLDILDGWAFVENKSKNERGYVKLELLESFSEDPGVGFLITSALLKESDDGHSKILTTIPQCSRVSIIKWKKEKILVRYKNYEGFVEQSLVYTKADFASWAIHKTKGWIPILNREGSVVRSKNNELIPIEELKAFITNKYRAFSLLNIDDGPKIRSRLEIKNLSGTIWNVSRLPEHGDVWWKKTPSQSTENKNSRWLTTDDILKKNIYSMAFTTDKSDTSNTSDKKIKGLISANGVYRTLDGFRWEEIDFFKNENWPVTITNKNIWIVGQYQSQNYGKSFEPYIRWEKLSNLLFNRKTHNHRFLKLLKLESHGDNDIDLWMDTGYKKSRVRYSFKDSSWKRIQ